MAEPPTVHCLYQFCAHRVPARVAYVPTDGGNYQETVALDGEAMMKHLTDVDHSLLTKKVQMKGLRVV